MAAALNASELSPNLTVNDIQKSIKFYTEGLGMEIVHKMEDGGKLQYVVMRGGTATIGVGQDDFAKGKDRKKGVGLRLWITTSQDISALAARATAAGIKLDEGPKALPWGPMAFAATDPDGFKVTVCAPMTH